jgi:hypothetical protein
VTETERITALLTRVLDRCVESDHQVHASAPAILALAEARLAAMQYERELANGYPPTVEERTAMRDHPGGYCQQCGAPGGGCESHATTSAVVARREPGGWRGLKVPDDFDAPMAIVDDWDAQLQALAPGWAWFRHDGAWWYVDSGVGKSGRAYSARIFPDSLVARSHEPVLALVRRRNGMTP